jgi:outer membrane immunogenic protein
MAWQYQFSVDRKHAASRVTMQERRVKRILIAGAFALTAGGQALAADLPERALPERAWIPIAPPLSTPPLPRIYNWGGFYLGINGGYGFGSSNWTGGAAPSGSFSTDGFLVGGTVGANYQMGAFVLGVEADDDYSWLGGSPPTTFCPNGSCWTRSDWLGTARGRLGYAFDRILLYATGGAAFGNVQAIANGVGNSSTEVGWTAGGGIEVAFAPNWTAKVEYLYVDLANESCTTACGSPPTQSVSLTENLVRAGINYKFGY